MAFDPVADLNALVTELSTDPITMGYNIGSTSDAQKKLNDPDNNVGGETVAAILTPKLLLETIAANPNDASVGAQFSDGLQFVISRLTDGWTADPDTSIEFARPAITAAMQANNPIRQALEAQNRALSRAEVLWGAGAVVPRPSIQEAWAIIG